MPDTTAPAAPDAKPAKRQSAKARTAAAGEQLAARMGALAASPAARTRAPRSARTTEAATPRQPRPAAAMPAEQPKPAAAFSARVSHTTTPQQLAALEAIRTEAKAQGSGAVAVTALIRAACELCLTDPKLRKRWLTLAKSPEWR